MKRGRSFCLTEPMRELIKLQVIYNYALNIEMPQIYTNCIYIFFLNRKISLTL